MDGDSSSPNLDTSLPAPENTGEHWKSLRSWPCRDSLISTTTFCVKLLLLQLQMLWICYLLVLERAADYLTALGEHLTYFQITYITNIGQEETASFGKECPSTTKEYKPGAANSAIHYVETSLQEGYNITHKCLLFWAALPMASDVFQLRCLSLILESVFALCFWANLKGYFLFRPLLFCFFLKLPIFGVSFGASSMVAAAIISR